MIDDLAEDLDYLGLIHSQQHMKSGVRLDHEVRGLDLWALIVDLY